MTYQIIDAKKAEHKILVSCKLMGVSPSGYFAWKKRGRERRRLCRDGVALAHVRERFSLSGETYGAPCVWHDLQEDGIGIGRNRIARLMRENDLKAHQNAVSRRQQTASIKGGSRQTCWPRTFPPITLIKNGRLTYPMFGQPRDGSILHSSSIFSHAGLLALQ